MVGAGGGEDRLHGLGCKREKIPVDLDCNWGLGDGKLVRMEFGYDTLFYHVARGRRSILQE